MNKEAVRQHIWSLMVERNVVRFPGAEGRIPNFVGAENAASRLSTLPEWKKAKTLKCNPDRPQHPVRMLALQQGKTVYMAVPRLREKKCFIQLDPKRLRGREREAATIKGATKLGRPVEPKDMPHIDLIVAGSVAVRRDGARLGKGGGYSDLEFGLARELGIADERTTIVTTIHSDQLTVLPFPMTIHDIPVDIVVTPQDTIHCPKRFDRPRGILWDHLTPEKISSIPVLAERHHR